ncbi:hypothetical protein HPB52_004404 [Rhipicephalus sanguineus]|uniref:Uncharacterized protein n=1 Tax=Rhipicephalus sanguineus TaxID=34632 RepID=A0A9D4T2V3_RHISA|nr:hypothetical protein HPB52_004404 [Rhipicephalus sanguineus]
MEDPVVCLAILDSWERKKLSLRTGAYSELVSALGKFTAVDNNTLIHDEEFEDFIDFEETTVPDKAKLKVTRIVATDLMEHLRAGGVDLKQQLEHEDEESTCIAATSLPVENGHNEPGAVTEQGKEPHAGLPSTHTATEGTHAAPQSYQRNSNEAIPSATHATRHRRGDTQGADAGTDDEAAGHTPGTPSQDAVRMSPPPSPSNPGASKQQSNDGKEKGPKATQHPRTTGSSQDESKAHDSQQPGDARKTRKKKKQNTASGRTPHVTLICGDDNTPRIAAALRHQLSNNVLVKTRVAKGGTLAAATRVMRDSLKGSQSDDDMQVLRNHVASTAAGFVICSVPESEAYGKEAHARAILLNARLKKLCSTPNPEFLDTSKVLEEKCGLIKEKNLYTGEASTLIVAEIAKVAKPFLGAKLSRYRKRDQPPPTNGGTCAPMPNQEARPPASPAVLPGGLVQGYYPRMVQAPPGYSHQHGGVPLPYSRVHPPQQEPRMMIAHSRIPCQQTYMPPSPAAQQAKSLHPRAHGDIYQILGNMVRQHMLTYGMVRNLDRPN